MPEKSDYACGHRHVWCVLVCINQYVHVDDLDPEGAVPLPFLLRCEYPRAFFGQDITAAFGVLRGVGRQMVCCTSMMQTFSLLRTVMLYSYPI